MASTGLFPQPLWISVRSGCELFEVMARLPRMSTEPRRRVAATGPKCGAGEHSICSVMLRSIRDRNGGAPQEAMMKQWISVAAFACLIGSASFVAAQTPAGGSNPQGGSGSGSTAKPQGGSGSGSTAKPQGGSGSGSTAKPQDAGARAQDGAAAADAMFIRTAGMDGMAEVEHGHSVHSGGAKRDARRSEAIRPADGRRPWQGER